MHYFFKTIFPQHC